MRLLSCNGNRVYVRNLIQLYSKAIDTIHYCIALLTKSLNTKRRKHSKFQHSVLLQEHVFYPNGPLYTFISGKKGREHYDWQWNCEIHLRYSYGRHQVSVITSDHTSIVFKRSESGAFAVHVGTSIKISSRVWLTDLGEISLVPNWNCNIHSVPSIPNKSVYQLINHWFQ